MPHVDRLFRLAMWMERDRGRAEDLVQDTLVQALQSFHRFTQGTNCRAWLVTILQHVRSNRRRSQLRHATVEDVDDQIAETVPFVPAVPQHITDEEMLSALRGIPEPFQDIILLCDVEEMTYKEIAEALAIPVGTVMSRLHRGRAALRKQLAGVQRGAQPMPQPGVSERGGVTMDCREVRRLAEAFVSGQLLVETTQSIVAHLDQCPACRAEIEGLRRLRSATRAAFAGSADLQMSPDFAARLSSHLQNVTVTSTAAPSRRWYWLAVAASVLLMLGAGLGFRAQSSAALLALLHAAVGDHQNCALSFKLAERPIPLAEAVHYDPANQALDVVGPSNSSLPGGPLEVVDRHSCVFEGRRFAHIVMRYRGQLVSLLVSADERSGLSVWAAGPPSDGTTSDVRVVDGMRVTAFHQARHSIFVVSSLSDDDVQKVAEVMVGPVSRALAGV